MIAAVKPIFQPVPEVVEYLEELLELAKKGEIREIAYAYGHPDGTYTTGYTATTNQLARLGSINRLAYRLLKVGDKEDS